MARGLAVAAVVCAVWFSRAGRRRQQRPGHLRDLQMKLTNAVDGDVITLNSSASPGGLCKAQYTLHSFPSRPRSRTTTRSGRSRDRRTDNDGFTDGLAGSAMLTGVDVHRLELQNSYSETAA